MKSTYNYLKMIKYVNPKAGNRILNENPAIEKTMENFYENVMKDIEIIDNKDIKFQDNIIGNDVAKVRQSEPDKSHSNVAGPIGFHEVF